MGILHSFTTGIISGHKKMSKIKNKLKLDCIVLKAINLKDDKYQLTGLIKTSIESIDWYGLYNEDCDTAFVSISDEGHINSFQ